MIDSVDRFGLKTRFLRKHRRDVDRFYQTLSRHEYQTEVAVGYARRFEKNRDRLFTFLEHDGVPWNNNNAEHAIKAFVRLRNIIGGTSTVKGLREYLVLLSISETCKCKGVSFLDFLQSEEADVDNLRQQTLNISPWGSAASSVERGYNIVDAEDLNMARELLPNRRKGSETTADRVTKNVTTAGKATISEDTGATEKSDCLGRQDTRRNRHFRLEVLAGATSWGFKSPSPHQFFGL